MTLAIGNEVCLDFYRRGWSGYEPQRGVVDDDVGASSPDTVRVCWENGATQFFKSTNEVLVGLLIMTHDSTNDVGKRMQCSMGNYEVLVQRTFTYGGNRFAIVRTVGVSESAGRPLVPTLYAIVLFSTLTQLR